ncbi:MAG: DotU family type IV/VI secretion system protein [Holosporales bacterium]|jgi:type IV/VI secretion system ImpK/VasF family protein|nr:DotU family type IV/VI secretion system protein [Holosporales bacterium]
MNFQASESAIVHGFQTFYYELLRQKEKALSLCFSPEISDNPSAEPGAKDDDLKKKNEIDGTVIEIQKKMLHVIESVTNTMRLKSRGLPKYVVDAKYIMTVLADEIFLNLRWEGAKFWRFTLLEKQLFQTEIAGDKFFSMMDEIVSSVEDNDIAFLYLMALSLGFKGRYGGVENAEEHISWYKDRLYILLNTRPVRLFFPGKPMMIESCYEYTNTTDSESCMPDSRFWSWCIISTVFLYIVISYCVWYGITGEIGDLLREIAKQTRQGPVI